MFGDCAAQVPDDFSVGCVGFAGRDRHEQHCRFAVFAEDGAGGLTVIGCGGFVQRAGEVFQRFRLPIGDFPAVARGGHNEHGLFVRAGKFVEQGLGPLGFGFGRGLFAGFGCFRRTENAEQHSHHH